MVLSAPQIEKEPRKSAAHRRRRWALVIVAVLLLAFIVPPFVHVGRFRRAVLGSISAGLGRPVQASSVELQLLPRPGFVLHQFVVSEDPAFGAEPVLTADKVTASVRFSSFWHWRVEIASLRFDRPSVNLVRNASGRWNFESLLHNSPALKKREASAARSSPSASTVPFPYVEASGARINFKFGLEKQPFSLEQTNLALWESGGEWRLRVRARPVRTDLAVANGGEIRGHATLIPAAAGDLMNSAIRLQLEWRDAQVGEIARILQGRANGWRGAVHWVTDAQGTLSDIRFRSNLRIEAFHRAEFLPVSEMDLSADCEGRYAHTARELNSLVCEVPLSDGKLTVRGLAAAKPDNPGSSRTEDVGKNREKPRRPLQIEVQNVPAQFLLDLFRHIHPGVDPGATASGKLNGLANCVWRGRETPATCAGELHSSEIRVRLPGFPQPLAISPIKLASPAVSSSAPSSRKRTARSEIPAREREALFSRFRPAVWNLLPAQVSVGSSSKAVVVGMLGSTGMALQIHGSADAAELGRLGAAFGVPILSGEVESIKGAANLSLLVRSRWLPVTGSNVEAPSATTEKADQFISALLPMSGVPETDLTEWTGSVRFEDVRLKLAPLHSPVHLATGQVTLAPGAVEWNGLDGTFAGIPFKGSLRWQIPCAGAVESCGRVFSLQFPHLDTGRLEAALRRRTGSFNLFNRINPWAAGPPRLPEMAGSVEANTLTAGPVSMKNVHLKLLIDGRRARLESISGSAFGGSLSGGWASNLPLPAGSAHRGAGSIEWSDGTPSYALRLTLHRIRPSAVAAVWQEHWGGGRATAGFDVKTHGVSAGELAQNASGTFAFAWNDGSFGSPSGSATSATPDLSNFRLWIAQGAIRNRALALESSRMLPANSRHRRPGKSPRVQTVRGVIGFDRKIHLTLAPSGTEIAGSVDAPKIGAAKSNAAAKVQNASTQNPFE